ncbi:rhomboid family protein [Leptospira andrefontaineae]|uniref:Rhomboid family intramembrane serine protease n=1 Tax=Leptospira andrefontaineae TaxID=2484976 RepID=A0A4R9H6L7_9LEPT|nr:rhomboid family intramembrane serine protease [Leptospira andrefontaineae]TGK41157.1 rhomboid family intramembrane serine protease [Leptospira andrefontaineae]
MNIPEKIPFLSILIFVTTLYGSYKGIVSNKFIDKYLLSSEGVLFRKQYYRIISSAFVHADWPHLIFNMASFALFAFDFEKEQGILKLLLVYFSSVIGGSIFGLINNQRNPDYQAVGASGGISGLVFASILSSSPFSIILYIPLAIEIPDWVYAYLFLSISYIGMQMKKGNIGHDAHLGGAIVGIIFITLLSYENVGQRYLLALGLSGFNILLICHYFYRKGFNGFDIGRIFKKIKERRISVRQEAIVLDLDKILDQVYKHGQESLSERDRRRLEEISKEI